MRMVRETLVSKPGGSPVYLRLSTGRAECEPKIKTPLLVDPDEALIEQVRRMLGGGGRRVWVGVGKALTPHSVCRGALPQRVEGRLWRCQPRLRPLPMGCL